MKKWIRHLSLYKQVLFFSFFITFVVIFMISSFSYALQTKKEIEQLTERVEGLSTLWTAVVSPDDVEKTIMLKDPNDPAVKRLQQQVNLINERNSSYFHSGIVATSINEDKGIYATVVSNSYEGLKPFSFYKSVDIHINALKEAIEEKKVVSTKVYTDDLGTWLSAFAPIQNEEGKVVGVLVIDAEASFIKNSQLETMLYLTVVFVITIVIVFFTLKYVLNNVMEPVDEILYGLHEVSVGNFNIHLSGKKNSNLDPLYERFNFMTQQLAILFDRLSISSPLNSKQAVSEEQLHTFEVAIGKMDTIIKETKLLKELQRAEKMNAIGQLAASVAHEIRNPMTVVKGFLQIFLAKDGLSEEEHMYVKLMLEEMNRAEKIINEYLSLAKPDLEFSEKVHAGELAHKVMDLMNSYALMSKSIGMKTNVSGDVFIKGNVSELKQVLINILKNGIEAMKDGGTLSLSVREEGHFGIFEIFDTGIGMSEDELQRLGTAFYSLKEKGTGMGLMVCYQIIERMRGTIEVESQKGVGTTFRIILPLFRE
ncbi:two-component sensor histidine kinase [Bacillus sp. Y1]|jgi:two-component system, sporulation sensor kinase B|uniref:ATP-binding protein n=1 Tax=Robertmurraya sp. TaxID=2837525 RepID=UPI000E6B3DF7|nr:ATP-binding protein [Bacillus sp. Y1]AYA76733.1 two-component sensor histidine kinase [Bacillus sp. Y1]